MKRSEQIKECKENIKIITHARSEIPAVVDKLVLSCNKDGCFDHVSAEPIPNRVAVVDILGRAARILYPGYFINTRLDQTNLEYYLGQEITAFFEVLSVGVKMHNEFLNMPGRAFLIPRFSEPANGWLPA